MWLKETCSKVDVINILCNAFHIQNGLKQGEALLPLLSVFAV